MRAGNSRATEIDAKACCALADSPLLILGNSTGAETGGTEAETGAGQRTGSGGSGIQPDRKQIGFPAAAGPGTAVGPEGEALAEGAVIVAEDGPVVDCPGAVESGTAEMRRKIGRREASAAGLFEARVEAEPEGAADPAPEGPKWDVPEGATQGARQ
jgi:hypothetical protein